MDCLSYPEACQNACFYTNCMRGVQGDTNNNNIYRVGRRDERDEHRRLAGFATDTGRPRSTGPFGQKFWDRYIFSDAEDVTAQDKTLDTDELADGLIPTRRWSANFVEMYHRDRQSECRTFMAKVSLPRIEGTKTRSRHKIQGRLRFHDVCCRKV